MICTSTLRWFGTSVALGCVWLALQGHAAAQHATISDNFGYPSAGSCCQSGGQFGQNWRDAHAAAQEQANKVYQRNVAWPKPFDCWDRQSYFAAWHPFYQAGANFEATLLESHFELNTDKLNTFGIRKLASIVGNQSLDLQSIFVADNGDAALTQARIDSVRATVNQMFGNTGLSVAASGQSVAPLSGRYHSTVSSLRSQQTPAPIINVGSQGSISGATSGN